MVRRLGIGHDFLLDFKTGDGLASNLISWLCFSES